MLLALIKPGRCCVVSKFPAISIAARHANTKPGPIWRRHGLGLESPFMIAQLVVLFLMVLFPGLVTIPAKWFAG